jgi:cytosine/adenosine deaminase-related metal-dependent hydrolase
VAWTSGGNGHDRAVLASGIFCAKNGVTLIIDHHASPFAIKDSLFTIAKAFDRVGVSHLLCYEISDRDGEGPREAGLAETDAFLAAGYQGHVGLHASFTVGDGLLQEAISLAKKHHTGLHIHVAEDLADQEETLTRYGRRVVERLQQAGALDLKTSILSHCIHLSEHEKELTRGSGVWVAENVESNQNNNVGLAHYRSITDKVLLGTDGMHSDMLRSAKAAFLAGQAMEGIGLDEIYRRFRNVPIRPLNRGSRYGEQSGDLNYDSPRVTQATFWSFRGADSRRMNVYLPGQGSWRGRWRLIEASAGLCAGDGQKLWDKIARAGVMENILVKNGLIVNAVDTFKADLLISQGVIARIGPNLEHRDASIIDAEGYYVIPGGVDVHTHLNLTANGIKVGDGFFRGTASAAFGGTTCVVEHPGFGPAGCSLLHQVEHYRKEAHGQAVVD